MLRAGDYLIRIGALLSAEAANNRKDTARLKYFEGFEDDKG